MRNSRLHAGVAYTLLSIAAALAIVPLLGVLIVATGRPDDVSGNVSFGSLHLGNFKQAWDQANMASAMRTSLTISICATVLTVLLCVPAGYALAMFKIRFRGLLFVLLISGLMLPNESIIIPLFFDYRRVGLDSSLLGVILVEAGLSIAFGAFWMRAFFLNAPTGLVEAARIDGANSLTILTRILSPLAVPQILALIVLVFVWTWNDLLNPLVLLTGSDKQSVTMALAIFQGQHQTNYALLAAAALITAAPVVLVYVVMQRSFSRGLVTGAIRE